MNRARIVLVVMLLLVGVGMVVWGATDDQCRAESEDVLICTGTGTGLIVAVAGGFVLGSAVTLGVMSRMR